MIFVRLCVDVMSHISIEWIFYLKLTEHLWTCCKKTGPVSKILNELKWLVWLNRWVFVYELKCYEREFHCSYSIFKFWTSMKKNFVIKRLFNLLIFNLSKCRETNNCIQKSKIFALNKQLTEAFFHRFPMKK